MQRNKLFPPDVSEKQYQSLQQVFNSGRSLQIETNVMFRKHAVWLNTQLVPLKNEAGEIHTVLGVSRNISESKLVEEKLKGSAALLKESQKVADLGSYVLDISSGFWRSSDIMDEVFGIDQDYKRDINGWIKIVHPDERKEMLDYFTTHVLAEGRLFDKEYRIIRKNDQKEHWVHGLGKLEFDADGNPVKMIGTIQNITERKQAEQQLIKLSQSVEQSPASVIEQSNDGIYVLQKDRFVFTNPRFAKLTGYKMDELRGDGFSFKSLFTDKGWAIVEEREVRRERGEKLPGRFIFEGVRKNGRKRDWESSVTEIDWEDNKATLGVLQDVTERIKVRDKLEAALEKARYAEKVKTLFLTNMSHEIRTPLNSIMGFTELIEQSFKKKSGPEELEFFENVQESSKRLMHTVHEVLDMSQIESETLPVNLKKYNLVVLLEKALKPLFPEAKAKGLELNVKTVTNAFIRADENCVVQAIVNLVDNAIKYTEKGRIDIELKEKGDSLELKIKDTGIGKEYIKDIFPVFTQESTGYTKKYQGVGLGLALVKNYLELCDAGLTVKSKKNGGSTFTVTFKKMKIEPGVKKEIRTGKKIKVSAAASKVKPQVLVVEDDQSSQRLISFFLRDYYDIKFAASVFEAKEKLRASPIEMVLLDLSLLGDEDGLDLARYMRKSKKWQKIPIIATTAHAFTEDRDKCLEAGCNDYIAKPIIRENLIEKMKQQLKRAK